MTAAAARDDSHLRFVWLELTGRCQLSCIHCYAASGPHSTHGSMTTDDWRRVLHQTAELGVSEVQFIGGEPTLYPGLPGLVHSALVHELEVEIYTNLVRVTPEMWRLFMLPGVLLATSYYSDDPAAHNAITQRRSHRQTHANIERTIALGIPLRVAVVEVDPAQDVHRAATALRELGVEQIHTDRIRQIGRGVRCGRQGPDQLCGLCGDMRMAVLTSGEAVPCVLSRWLTLGNVRESDLAMLYRRVRAVHDELWAPSHGSAMSGCPPTDGTPGCTSPTCTPPMRVCPPPCPPPYPLPR